jgi:hypothetical protein
MEEQRTYRSNKGRLTGAQMSQLEDALDCDLNELGPARESDHWLYTIPASIEHSPNREHFKAVGLAWQQ